MSLVARVVRVFQADTPAGGVAEQRLHLDLDLPICPARGQHVLLPGLTEPVPIARVIVSAQPGDRGWDPGFLPPRVTIELAPEDPAGLAGAFQRGWTTAKD